MATLNLRLDPTQMERGADRAEKSLKDVKREASQAESAIDRMASSGGRSATRMGQAVQGMGARMQAARGQIQNVAFQLGDFATQVGAGTAASVALGQQLPQLLGGFGALGAVMGAVVAIGVPLAANLLDIGGKAADLDKQFADLEKSLDRVEDAVQRASRAGRDDLVEAFGAVTASIISLVEAEKQLSLIEAAKDLEAARDVIAGFGDTGPSGRRGAILGEAAIAIERLRYQFNITAEDAERLYKAFQDIDAAEGPREMAQSYVRIRDLLVEAVGGWEKLNDEQLEFIGHINSAQNAAERMGDALYESDDAARDLSATIDGISLSHIISDANILVNRFTSAASAIGQMMAAAGKAGQRAISEGQKIDLQEYEINQRRSGASDASIAGGLAAMRERFRLEGEGIPPAMVESLVEQARARGEEIASNQAIIQGFNKKSGSSSGRKKVSEIDRTAQAYDRLIASLDPAARAAQDYAEAQDVITEAQARGVISAEEAARAYGLAGEEYQEALKKIEDEASGLDDITNATSDAFGQLFDGIIDGGTEAADVLNSLAAQLIKMGLQSALSSAFPKIFGDDGWLSFDGGGYTGSGSRTGGVDGKGGFPAILHPNETVVDHTRAANNGGGSGVSVQVNNFADNTETRQRRQSGPNGEEVVIDIVNKGAAEGRLTGVQSRYNLQNQKVRR